MAGDISLRIAVLLGGESPEREISLASGICAAAALDEAGHRPRDIDPAEVDLRDVDWRQFDVAFIALHGGAGEDGRVQGQLEALGVRYTGSGPAASRRGMSKAASKRRFRKCGVPTPQFVVLDAGKPIDQMRQRVEALGYPLVVKPDAQGSSLGVSLAEDAEQFGPAVADSQLYDDSLVFEPYLAGSEFTVAVLGRQPLPALEVVTDACIFSYTAKYHDSTTDFLPASETGFERAGELEKLATAAAAALETSGLVRVDLRLDLEGRPYVLEVNTVPGLTERSMAPQAARLAGLDMPALCERMVRECLASEVTP